MRANPPVALYYLRLLAKERRAKERIPNPSLKSLSLKVKSLPYYSLKVTFVVELILLVDSMSIVYVVYSYHALLSLDITFTCLEG